MSGYTEGPNYSNINPRGGAGLLVVAAAFLTLGRMFPPAQALVLAATVIGGALALFPIMRWLSARRGAGSDRPLSLVPPNPSLQADGAERAPPPNSESSTN